MDRTLLNNATSPNRDPVNGYHLSQITQLSYSNPESCQQLEEYLLQRLMRDNPNTKFKALRVIRHLAEKGKPDFKRSIRRKSDPIKIYQTFQGTFDPIHGDSLSKQIREEASKCLTAIFNDDNNDSYNQQFAHRIAGIGSSKVDTHPELSNYNNETHRSYNQPSSIGSQRGKFIGIGNPNFDNTSSSYPHLGYTTSALKALNDVADRYFPSVKETIIKNSNLFNNTLHDQYQDRRSHNFQSNNFNKPNTGPAYYDQKFTYPAMREAISSNEYETKLVDNLLAPGGVLPTIPTASLDSFIVKCRSLDLEVIGNILYQRFTQKDSDETTKTRSLIIIGKLLSIDDNIIMQQRYTFENMVKEKFSYSLKEIINKSNSKPELKESCANILKLLSIDFDESKVQMKDPEENLFDFMNTDVINDKKRETNTTTIDDLFSAMDNINLSGQKEPQRTDDLNWDFFDSPSNKSKSQGADLEQDTYMDIFDSGNSYKKQTTPTLEQLNSPTLFENLTSHPQPSIKSDKTSNDEKKKYVTQFGNFIYTSDEPFPSIETSFSFKEDFTQTNDPFGLLTSNNIQKVDSFPVAPNTSINSLSNLQDSFINELFNTHSETPKNQTPAPNPFNSFADF